MMLVDESGKPKDFSFVEIRQYGDRYTAREFSTYGELLDAFYSEKDAADRMRQRSLDLQKLLAATQERIARRLDNQHRELEESADREKYKIFGDLLRPICTPSRRATAGLWCRITMRGVPRGGDPARSPSEPPIRMYRSTITSTASGIPLRRNSGSRLPRARRSLPILSRCPTCCPGPDRCGPHCHPPGAVPGGVSQALCLQGEEGGEAAAAAI